MAQFIIGIGSQRAGSTLLHRVLDECTNIFMHPVKELHYFDTAYDVRDASVLEDFSKRQLDNELDRLVESKDFEYIDKKYKCFIRTNKVLAHKPIDKVSYIDLFRPCLMDHEVFGEITPEYMILPENGVQKMAEELGEHTKIILLARDPVDRFISAFKLLKSYNNPSYDSSAFAKDLEDTIVRMPGWIDQQIELNDYETALKKYKKYFNNVLFLSFEKMVDDPGFLHTQLSDFLDCKVDRDKLLDVMGEKVNAISVTKDIPSNLYSIIEERCINHRDFLKQEFG